MDIEYCGNLIKILAEGLTVSLKIFILTLVFAIPMGVIVSILLRNKNKFVKFITNVYVLVMRGTPLLLQIICVYFVPYYVFNITCNRFIAVIIAFSLNYAAYFGEIFRGGIESVSIGQWEVSYTLGFTKIKTFFYIIFPQVIKKVLPAISNEVITLIRDTSLAQVIGIVELFSLAKKQASFKFSIIPLILAGGIYLIFSLLLTLLFKYAEKKLSYYR